MTTTTLEPITALDVKDHIGPDSKLYLALRPGQEKLLYIPENPYITIVTLERLEKLDGFEPGYRFAAMTEPIPYLDGDMRQIARADPDKFGLFGFEDTGGMQVFLDEINGGPVQPHATRWCTPVLKPDRSSGPPQEDIPTSVEEVEEAALPIADAKPIEDALGPAMEIGDEIPEAEVVPEAEAPPIQEVDSELGSDPLPLDEDLNPTAETGEGDEDIMPNKNSTKERKPTVRAGFEAYLEATDKTADEIDSREFPAITKFIKRETGLVAKPGYLYTIISQLRKAASAPKKAGRPAGTKEVAAAPANNSAEAVPSSNRYEAKVARLLKLAKLAEALENPAVGEFLALLGEIDPSRTADLEEDFNSAREAVRVLESV
jgi:hypothetical protein